MSTKKPNDAQLEDQLSYSLIDVADSFPTFFLEFSVEYIGERRFCPTSVGHLIKLERYRED